MTHYLGCDPSQRHTGICIRRGERAAFCEIKTERLDILQSCIMIRQAFARLIAPLPTDTVFSVERQIVVGANYAALQFHVAQIIFEEIYYHSGDDARIVLPSPLQLKQYMSRVHNVDASSKKGIVDSFHKEFGKKGRKKSSHKVEAYYLTHLAEACIDGKWYYKFEERQSVSIPWSPIQGVKPPKKTKLRLPKGGKNERSC